MNWELETSAPVDNGDVYYCDHGRTWDCPDCEIHEYWLEHSEHTA